MAETQKQKLRGNAGKGTSSNVALAPLNVKYVTHVSRLLNKNAIATTSNESADVKRSVGKETTTIADSSGKQNQVNEENWQRVAVFAPTPADHIHQLLFDPPRPKVISPQDAEETGAQSRLLPPQLLISTTMQDPKNYYSAYDIFGFYHGLMGQLHQVITNHQADVGEKLRNTENERDEYKLHADNYKLELSSVHQGKEELTRKHEEELHAVKDEWKKETTLLTADLMKAKEEIKRLSCEMTVSKTELEFKNQEISLLKQENEESTSKFKDELDVAKDEWKKETTVLTENLRKAEVEINRQSTEISSHATDQEFKNQEITNMHIHSIRLGKMKDDLERGFKEMEKERNTLKKRVLQYEAECKVKDENMKKVTQCKSDLEVKLRETSNKLSESQKNSAEKLSAKNNCIKDLSRTVKEQGEKFQRKLVHHESKIKQLTATITKLTNEMKETEKILGEKEKELSESVNNFRAEKEELNANLKEKNCRITYLESRCDEITDTMEQMTNDSKDERELVRLILEEETELLEKPTLLRQLIEERIRNDMNNTDVEENSSATSPLLQQETPNASPKPEHQNKNRTAKRKTSLLKGNGETSHKKRR